MDVKEKNMKGSVIEENIDAQIQKIRPAGRHILTIGEDLIKDKFAAIVELVKNSYDADSPDVNVVFSLDKVKNVMKIIVEDSGIGMTRADVVNKWLVPSTTYKAVVRKSDNGRIMQGRKGIGRYAASILGIDLLMETTDKNGEKTTIYLMWDKFRKAKYLDEVEVLVDSKKEDQKSGTKITIEASMEEYCEWIASDQIKSLKHELRKLISPKVDGVFEEDFKIKLSFCDFYEDDTKNTEEYMEPYPILELFDYQIRGALDKSGNGVFEYINKKTKNTIEEDIKVAYGETHCGNLVFDIRVYDRGPEDISALINRGLADNDGEPLSKSETKVLLDNINGVGVYRNGFRIRPLGDPGYDWLDLNAQRIQNPSMKIGHNQIVAYVHIQSEEESNLEEKSARDGLKDNFAYKQLVAITGKIIVLLEERRFKYRERLELGRPKRKIEKQLEELYDYSSLKKDISTNLKKARISEPIIEEILILIAKEQQKKNIIADDIKNIVAIYQGQATLGKIIDAVLHEGRRPLGYFKNQLPNLDFYTNKFKRKPDNPSVDKIIEIASGIERNTDIFIKLFGRLDPLAAKKRSAKKIISLKKLFNDLSGIFEQELKQIKLKIDIDEKATFKGWEQDLYAIFANLIENSIFWINQQNPQIKIINIKAEGSENYLHVDYIDSGPGIDAAMIESQIIFEPRFTTKKFGSGLGLSIAGEAAHRNGLELKALQSDSGAHFQLNTIQNEEVL